jgi:two-component system chemotaxis response regulator CheB
VRPIRILVVDDSVVARKVISDILAEEEDFEVVGTAPNGKIALTKIERLEPDLVTLDIDMPELDGIATLTAIRSSHPRVRVIMVSNHTKRGASVTVEALFLGASDYVTKAAGSSTRDAARSYLQEQLVPKIRALSLPATPGGRSPAPVRAQGAQWRGAATTPISVVVIGASTGGPNALTTVLEALPADFPAPVLIVQHLPANFTTFFAHRLDAACSLSVREANSRDGVTPGTICVAPGGMHLETRRRGGRKILITTDGPLVNSCRPAADILFRSVAKIFGAGTLAVILTGMGRDGLDGCREIRAAGGRVIAQDKATSIVWGMPGQVAEAGLADVVLPINDIGPEIVRRVMTRHE